MPRYKLGKVTDTIDLEFLKERMQKGTFVKPWRDRAYVALLYWTGVRRSELYERVREDFVITEMDLIVDFHQRKKGGLTVPSLEIPRSLPYLQIIEQQIERTRPGRRVWAISGWTAWRIVKRALGPQYYPHFLRLNRITRMFDDPTTTVPEAKSWTGIKSSKALDSYIGYSRRRMEKGKARLKQELE